MSVSRAELESRDAWVGTFELVESPGLYRVLMQFPKNDGFYWFDVYRNKMPWQWGLTNRYEGHGSLREFIDRGFLRLVEGVLPWELEDEEDSKESEIIEQVVEELLNGGTDEG